MPTPFDSSLEPGQTRRFRDLVLLHIAAEEIVCIACDSSGGYGPKPNDVRAASGFDVGFAVAKVPLMEVLAAGATPRALVNNLCVEMKPTGLPILDGIRAACALTGYDVEVTGSDETNIPTTTTGVGTTVIALLDRAANRLGSSRAGDQLLVVGKSLGGDPEHADYREGDNAVAGIDTILAMLAADGVHEILPVGSRGIAYECGELASAAGLTYDLKPNPGVDLIRSAGASTAVICSVDPGVVGAAELRAATSKVTTHIGELR